MGYNEAIRAEIDSDPLARNYAGMADDPGDPASTDWQSRADKISASLRTADRTRTLSSLEGAEIYAAIDESEYTGLTQRPQSRVDAITRLGGPIDVGPGSTARAVLTSAFGGGSATIAALVIAVTIPQTRAEELGVGSRVGHVQEALRL